MFFSKKVNFFNIYSIAKLNSTPLWNLILQITLLSNVEFNSSYFYFIILYINMALPPSIKEALMNKHTHLNLDARILIETLLNQQHSFKSIARHLGKDCTTISKEVKSHICFEKSGTYGRSFNDCRLAFLINVPFIKFFSTVPPLITDTAGPAADAFPLVILMKNTFALNFPNLPMSATAVRNAPNAL